MRVKNGPCAPLRFISMLSRPATGTTRSSVTTGVAFAWMEFEDMERYLKKAPNLALEKACKSGGTSWAPPPHSCAMRVPQRGLLLDSAPPSGVVPAGRLRARKPAAAAISEAAARPYRPPLIEPVCCCR